MVGRAVSAFLALAASGSIASCAAMSDNTRGPMQPQMVTGPCEVKRFFFLGLRSVPVSMQVTNTGQVCTMALINPALNEVVNAALVSATAQHGLAQAGVTAGARQAVVSYAPVPGYAGPDTFGVTLEPNAAGITVEVAVSPPR